VAGPSVESARREWEAGHRRLLDAARDRPRYERLLEQVAVVGDELRRRIGQTFTLSELADAYRAAERWSRDAVAERASVDARPGDLALVEDAAFHLYSRGATDYSP
jgi:hypothetical protein